MRVKRLDVGTPENAAGLGKFRSWPRWLSTALALMLGLCISQDAWAQSRRAKARRTPARSQTGSQINVAVLPFEGPNTGRLRTNVSKALLRHKKKVKAIPIKKLDTTAADLGADLASAKGRVAVARELSIAAFIDGELVKRGSTAELTMHVYDGQTGEVVGETTFKGKPAVVERQGRTRFWLKLNKIILATKPPPPQTAPEPQARPQRRTTEPAPTGEEPESQFAEREALEDVEETPGRKRDEQLAEAEPEAQEGATPVALELGARLRMLTRSFTYNDAAPQSLLAKHTLIPTPAFRVEARWYPGAHFTTGVAANLGLDVYGQFMYPVTATNKKLNADFDTSSSAFGLAARFRVPLSVHELGLFAGYASQTFNFEDATNALAQVPSVSYGSIRIGGDARFALTETISLGVQASYFIVQGFGELGTAPWFPHVAGNGLDLEVRGGYALSKSFELNASVGLTRYAMSLHPEPTDPGVQGTTNSGSPRIAGGLTDQYVTGGIGVGWRP